jgi:hypothetical protein
LRSGGSRGRGLGALVEGDGDTADGDQAEPRSLGGVTSDGVGVASSSASTDNGDWDTVKTNGDVDVRDVDIEETNELGGRFVASGGDALAALIRRCGSRGRGLGAFVEGDGDTADGDKAEPRSLRGVASNGVGVASSSASANDSDGDTVETDGDVEVRDVDTEETDDLGSRVGASGGHRLATLVRRGGGRGRSVVPAEADRKTTDSDKTTVRSVVASNGLLVASSRAATNNSDGDTVESDGDVEVGDVNAQKSKNLASRLASSIRHSGTALIRRRRRRRGPTTAASATSGSGSRKSSEDRGENKSFELHVGDAWRLVLEL